MDDGLKAIPDKKELYIARARLADSQKQFDQGEKYLLDIEKLQQKDIDIQAELVRHYIMAKQFDKAEQALRKQMQLEPDKEKHVVTLARFFSRLK